MSKKPQSQVLWSSHDAEIATGGHSTLPWQARGISIDTRQLQKGDLFIALTDKRDGHDFVAQAFDKGAAAALVREIPKDAPQDKPYLVVPEVMRGLQDLARFARARTHAKVIAVTGSAGKTTTKNMLAHILPGAVHAAVASFNNHWGVPLTLARMPAHCDYAVVEIGTNHPGEIAPLSRMTRPHVSIVTTIAAAHVEGFSRYRHWSSALDLIALEKAQIFEGLEPSGAAIIGADGMRGLALGAIAQGKGAQPIFIGNAAPFDLAQTFPAYLNIRSESQTIVWHAVRKQTDRQWLHQVSWLGRPIDLELGQDAPHLIHNMLLALAAGCAAGADFVGLCERAKTWQPSSGRGARFEARLPKANITVLDESYNANPASMRAALSTLFAQKGRGPLVAILGDMAELGVDSEQYHREIGTFIAQSQKAGVPFHLWTLGKNAKYYAHGLDPACHRSFASVEEINGAVLELDFDCAILLKASNSIGLNAVVSVLKSHKQEAKDA